MDADYLTDLLRVEGVVVAFVASFPTAPAATEHLWTRLKRRLQNVWHGVGSEVHRLRLRLTRRREVPLSDSIKFEDALGMAPVTSSVSTSWNVNAEDDLSSRMTRLERRVANYSSK